MKRLLSLIISLVILGLIYWKIDLQSLVEVFRGGDRLWLVISLGMVVPLTGLTAVRLQCLVPTETKFSLAEANRLILAACTLNMILPSKMGDIAKAYFMRERGHLDGALSLSLVVFEKTCDMLSLLLWCGFGLLLYPQKDWLFWLLTLAVVSGFIVGVLLIGSRSFTRWGVGVCQRFLAPSRFGSTGNSLLAKLQGFQDAWEVMHRYFWSNPLRLVSVTSLSIFIWFLHLVQIWFFTIALQATVPFLANLALSPLAILAGLLPLTFAGVGTRDAALILFYQPYMSEATAAALGILCTCRYLLPAIGGLPLLGKYLSVIPEGSKPKGARKRKIRHD